MRVRACSLWLVLALVACSGTERSTTGVLSADAIQERVASAHFRRHITQSPRTLDPSLNFDIPGQFVIDDLFEGLVRLDPQGSIVPAVAQRWDISEDGLQWRFFLREARWSNGQPVTAGDFVYAWRRAVDPATASEVAQHGVRDSGR
jgi:ABC-type oligopeptide transport system substrate-binding subunit